MRRLPFLRVRWIVPAVLLLVAGSLVADSGPDHQAKQTLPIKLGTSGGSIADRSRAFCCGGTLGAAVNYSGALHILSNNHVLARSGAAADGEDTIQPGLIDVGCNGSLANVVGDFIGDVVPLGTANVDAALSLARANAVSETGEILDIGVPCSAMQTPAVGLNVMKSGRTTGFTESSIESVSADVSVQYQRGCGSGRRFTITYTDQVVVSGAEFSDAGDSGSLILSNDGSPNPVALLYAGSSTSTIGNPVQDVAAAFGSSFSFVGSDCSASATSWSAAAAARAPSDNDIEFARVIKERHKRDLLALPGVYGVGVGASLADATRAAITVYVDHGQARRPYGFPEELDGVPVRLIPTDPFVAR
jgi:hypothetical protein